VFSIILVAVNYININIHIRDQSLVIVIDGQKFVLIVDTLLDGWCW
jgi:hypothetical protein